jgi:GTP cyclohydrolase FolE2
MLQPESPALPDIQSQADARDLAIEAAGVSGIRYPLTIQAGKAPLQTIASVSMSVGLASTTKGTHMSRFLELLEAQKEPLDQARFKVLLLEMLARLEAHSGTLEVRFPYFVRKSAPVSRAQSLLDYEVCWRGRGFDDGRYSFWAGVTVPVTSLCPCSKEISAYGAHNQRSHITIEAELVGEMSPDELIRIAECNASCEVYGLLKRPDEKYVTERAYENPKFAEDLVRDIAIALNQEPRVRAYTIEAQNFESIHNHSAFARIVRPASATPPMQPGKHVDRHLHLVVTGIAS